MLGNILTRTNNYPKSQERKERQDSKSVILESNPMKNESSPFERQRDSYYEKMTMTRKKDVDVSTCKSKNGYKVTRLTDARMKKANQTFFNIKKELK